MSGSLAIETLSSVAARVVGRIDVENAGSVLTRGAEIFVGERINADISGLQSADSVTIAVLLAWAERARNAGSTLNFTGVSPGLRAIAHLGDVESLLGFDETSRNQSEPTDMGARQ